jgi:hypothetical protein
MEREFERFRGGPNEPASKRVHVTISPAKLILFNRNVFNLMGQPVAVFLDFSRKRDIIAIEPTSPRFNDAFPVKQTGSSFRINSAPFCVHFRIDIDQTLKFIQPEMVGNALHLKLNETVSVAGRKRKKKRE